MSQLTISQIQLDNMTPSKGIVLCIPHVHKNIPDHRVKARMIKAYLGHINRVDVVPVVGKPYNRAFIHFAPNRWNMRNPNAMRALSQMQDGESIQVYYNDNYYWNVVISNCKPLTEEEVAEKKRVRIKVHRRENPAQRKKVLDLDTPVCSSVKPVAVLDANDPIGARVLASTPSPKRGEQLC